MGHAMREEYIDHATFHDDKLCRQWEVYPEWYYDQERIVSTRRTSTTSLCKTPLLTPEQETFLFGKFNYLKYSKRYGVALAVRDVIFLSNYRILVNMSKVRAKAKPDAFSLFDDLAQHGALALIRAIDKFDINNKFKFSTFAMSCLFRQYKDYFRKCGQTNRINATQQLEFRNPDDMPEDLLVSWDDEYEFPKNFAAMRKCMDDLEITEKEQQAILKRFDDKLTIQQVAEVYGVQRSRQAEIMKELRLNAHKIQEVMPCLSR
jgi:RNA polymerase sigma factor (sigma-70 family)